MIHSNAQMGHSADTPDIIWRTSFAQIASVIIKSSFEKSFKFILRTYRLFYNVPYVFHWNIHGKLSYQNKPRKQKNSDAEIR